MIHSLLGKLIIKKRDFAVIETNGIGFKVLVSSKTFRTLPQLGSRLRIFCYFYVRQDGAELYGFLKEDELDFFKMLTSITGVGPRTALRIIGITSINRLLTAVNQRRTDLLIKTSGVGKKTANRIILELSDKIKSSKDEELLSLMESDSDIEEALKGLGYKQREIQEALRKISSKIKKTEERLKMALKILGR
ncbi:MAG TPA: Holliday junction branch migration protein RuvA [Candidatus Wolfebacteria bacterium]|nr:Holliday junction branch migration protein RuvA [Candidatus Wolfebacteria bacterium]